MNNAAILFNNVSKTYNNANNVINGLNFEVPAGAVFGLIGSNAIGKTTIIKCILNLVSLSEGSIEIFGKDNTNKLSREDVFYLPENFLPPKNLTAMEFLQSYLKILNVTLDEQKINHYIKMLDINPKYIDFKISACSKGTVQKFGLLLAFLSEKKLLILDEPSTGLDVKARNSLQNTIEYFKLSGGTVFLSSHIFSDLEQTCTHFGIFDKANFAFFGTKNDLTKMQEGQNVKTLEQLFLKIILADCKN